MFSTGVLMAMSSGALAAEAINVWLENRKAGERLLRSYERKMRRGLEAISWLIHRINTTVLRDMFMSSIDMFDIRDRVVAILAGDFYEKRGHIFVEVMKRFNELPADERKDILRRAEDHERGGGSQLLK
jgi:flavin-dependent dehydrogenase